MEVMLLIVIKDNNSIPIKRKIIYFYNYNFKYFISKIVFTFYLKRLLISIGEYLLNRKLN